MKDSAFEKHDKLFFLSYANIFAGLFFIFLLIIIMLIFKNSFAQSSINQAKQQLNEQKLKFQQEKDLFKQNQIKLFELGQNLEQDLDINKLSSEDKALLALIASLNEKEEQLMDFRQDYEKLKQDFESLIQIKNAFILELQAKFDFNISLNANASMNLYTANLFDKGSYVLNNETANKLKQLLIQYFDFILNNDELYSKLEHIIIKVYSDDEGSSLMYKLDLSARRAVELSNFIYSFYKDKRLHKILLISAKTSKDNSNRLELDMSISNEALFKKLEHFFNERI